MKYSDKCAIIEVKEDTFQTDEGKTVTYRFVRLMDNLYQIYKVKIDANLVEKITKLRGQKCVVDLEMRAGYKEKPDIYLVGAEIIK